MATSTEQQAARLEPYRLLEEAEADVRAGDRGSSIEAVRLRLRIARAQRGDRGGERGLGEAEAAGEE